MRAPARTLPTLLRGQIVYGFAAFLRAGGVAAFAVSLPATLSNASESFALDGH
jgi:hypothetical protein